MYPLTSVDSVKYLRSNSVGKCLTLHHYKYSHNIGQIQWESVSLYTTTNIPTISVKFSGNVSHFTPLQIFPQYWSNSVGMCLTLHHYKYSHNIGQIQWECVSLYTTTNIPTISVKFSGNVSHFTPLQIFPQYWSNSQ